MKIAMWTSVALGIWACGKHPNTGSKSSKVAGPTVNRSGHAVAPNNDSTEPPPAPTVRPNTKGDCSTQYAPRPKRDPNPMCKIDGGTFRMGDDKFNMRVRLSPYYMDEFEVTVAQVVFYLNTTHDDSCIDPVTKEPCFRLLTPTDGKHYEVYARKLANGRIVAEPGTEHRPFASASREGAMRYCAWAGKSLPTEPQWEFAARHDPKTSKDLIYPWGDTFDGTRARCDHAVCPDGPNDNDPVDVGLYDGTHGHADGRSPWGLCDMAGNAAELVADCEHEYAPCKSNDGVCVDPPPAPPQPIISQPPPPPPGTECTIVVRGGGVQRDSQLRTFDQETFDSGGFRCVRAAP